MIWLAACALLLLAAAVLLALWWWGAKLDGVEPAPLESGEPRAAVRAAMERRRR